MIFARTTESANLCLSVVVNAAELHLLHCYQKALAAAGGGGRVRDDVYSQHDVTRNQSDPLTLISVEPNRRPTHKVRCYTPLRGL